MSARSSLVFSSPVLWGLLLLLIGGPRRCAWAQAGQAAEDASGGVVYWNGTQSSAWADERNWTPAMLPGPLDSVVITFAKNHPRLAGSLVEIGQLTVHPSAHLGLDAGANIQLSGSLRVEGTLSGPGTLTLAGSTPQTLAGRFDLGRLVIVNLAGAALLSDGSRIRQSLYVQQGMLDLGGHTLLLASTAGGTAYLENVAAGTLLNAQNLQAERWLPSVAGGAWAFVGSQVQGQQLGGWSLPANAYTPGTFDAATGRDLSIYAYYPAGTAHPQNNGYVHAGASEAAPAPVGTGYRVWTSPGFYAAGGTFTQQGAPHLGALTFPLAYCASGCAYPSSGPTNGWNLVANPYAAPISWADSSWYKANVAAAVWTWNPATATWASYLPGVGGVNGGSPVIASGQAFFVKTVAAGASMTVQPATVPAALRLLHDSAALARSVDESRNLRLQLGNGAATDEVLLALRPTASRSYRADEDAAKMIGAGPVLCLAGREGPSMAISSQPLPQTGSDTVGLKVAGSGALALRLTHPVDGLQAALLDRLAGSTTPITTGTSYPVQADGGTPRYALLLIPSAPAQPPAPATLPTTLSLYPNPARSQVRLSAGQSLTGVRIYTAAGERVMTRPLSGKQATIAVSELLKGTYTLEATTESRLTLRQQLVIQ